VTWDVTVENIDRIDEAFGDVGLKVGSRTKRTKDEKEWYVVRRFLKAAIRAELLPTPFQIRKGRVPEPDFICLQNQVLTAIEITEASHPSDQKEMTKIETSDQIAVLLGEFGGRFKDGAGEPGHVWASDIREAIERKEGKSIFSGAYSMGHLVIYPNSNASFLLFDFEDEQRAFEIFKKALRSGYPSCETGGAQVHILGLKAVFFDVLGDSKCMRQERDLAR
jgi:hypothetical protein